MRATAAPASPELTAKIDSLFAKWAKPDSPGVIVAIAQGGETIHARGYGMANLEHGVPLTPDTISESGSVAKQFTAAAVVLLSLRGRLSLDESIRKHLPEMAASICDSITVRMLLNHTSGLRDIHGLNDLLGRPSYSSQHDNAGVLRVMSRQRRLNFEPGTEYLYCNASYVLAAIIVERVGGKSFNAFCEEELFRPRGMTHTRWRDDFVAVVPGRASGYAPRRGGGYRIDLPYSNIVGSGGLLTTVGDLLKWNASLEGATGEWAELARLLQTPSRLKNGRAINYGLGLTIDEATPGRREISHGGSTSGYRTFLTRLPEHRLAVALLGNAADFDGAAASRAVLQAVLGSPRTERPKGIKLGAAELAAAAGMYHSAQADSLVTLTVRDGRLHQGATALIPTGPGTFANANGRAELVFGGGSQRSFVLTTTNEVVTYSAVATATPTAAQLVAYAGTYYSEELEVVCKVTVRDGKLSLGRWPEPERTGEPTFADGFRFAGGWHATFTRDASGRVTGCELTNGRCRRVRFERR